MPGSLCTRNDVPERRHCAATRRARHARAGAAWRVGLSGSVRPCHAWTAAPGEDDAAARYRFSRRAPPLWCPATPQGRPPAGAGGTYRWTDPVTDRPGYGPGCSGATENCSLQSAWAGGLVALGYSCTPGVTVAGWVGRRQSNLPSESAGRSRSA